MSSQGVIDLTNSDDDGLQHTTSSRKRKRNPPSTHHREGRSREALSPSRKASRSPSPGSFFFEDTTPNSSIVPYAPAAENTASTAEGANVALLLPSHVLLLSGDEKDVVKITAPEPAEYQEYVEYLEYDTRDLPTVRYFHDLDVREDTAPTRIVCKKCGAENDHRSDKCTVKICRLCGLRDEHSERGCPTLKTCFNCGMKGHLSFKCPERRGTRRGDAENDCERCGSRNHQSRECPNIWRMYEYLSEKESRKVLQRRLEAKGKPLGQGGEAYVCSDAYCYNCGKKGHWGDDCGQMLRFGTQNKPTAFSLQNLRTGPFYDDNDDDHDDFDERYDVVASQIAQFSASERENHRQREQDHATIRRDRQNLSNGLKGPDTPPDWYAGNSLPDRVGNKGKRKRLEQLQNQVQEEADNEQDDWFASQKDQRASKRAKDNTHARPSPSELPNTNRGRQFSIAIKGVALSRQSSGNNNRGGSTTSSTRQHQPPPPPHPLPIPARRPSLIDRLGDSGLSGKDTSRPPPRESDGVDKRHWNDMSRVALKAGRGSNQNGHQLADNEKEKKNRSINRSGSSSKQRRDGKNSTGSSTGNKPRYGGGYTT